MADQLHIATQSGSAEVDGESVVFIKNVTMVPDGHPLLKAVPDYFTPAEDGRGYGTATIQHTATDEEIAQWEADEAARETLANGQDVGGQEETTTVTFDATEKAIEFAADHGVDLALVTGTLDGGRISQPDVAHYVATVRGDDPPENDDENDENDDDENENEDV